MQRSFLFPIRAFLLPLLVLGLVLAGCDSSGSGTTEDPAPPSNAPNVYPTPTSEASYAEEIAINLQSAGLGIRLENDPSPSTLQNIYTGPAANQSIRRISGLSQTFEQTTYGDIQSGVDLSAALSTEPLLRSDQLDAADTDQPGTLRTADQLISYYLEQATETSPNGVDFSQLSEKGVAGALSFYEGAEILNDFVDDGSVASSPADAWNEAFGHFGAPRDFTAFLDYTNPEGLVGGSSFQDRNGDNAVDLVREAVYIWAGYTAERAAAAEQAGAPNDFARRAFEAFRLGRVDIDNGTDPSDHAAAALDAWDATVAVNVIHYINGMQGALDAVEGEITAEKLADPAGFQDSWGEAKAFVWTLQFNETGPLSDAELRTIHDRIGNDPPYSEGVVASEYTADLTTVKETLRDAYGFDSSNVAAW
jgi:hypothetical protein